MKQKLIFLAAIILATTLSNNVFTQSKNLPYEIIIDKDGFSSFDGKNYTSITIFLNNNTNDTLYYQGADCYNLLFTLKPNPYFHLDTDICRNIVYSKMILPPHRSQKMQIFLTMDKAPSHDVLLSIKMKLYKWTEKKENELLDKLSDTTILHYNNNHQSFWPREEFALLDKKEQRILPNKDIYLLTDADRKLYEIKVDEKQITKGRDTVLKEFGDKLSKKVAVISVPVSLINKSNGTLQFYSMSCSWFEFWGTNRKDIGVSGWACDKNIPEIITILPHQVYKRRLDIIYYSTIKNGSLYKISMSLLKTPSNAKRTWGFWPDDYVRFNKIWSNELTIQ